MIRHPGEAFNKTTLDLAQAFSDAVAPETDLFTVLQAIAILLGSTLDQIARRGSEPMAMADRQALAKTITSLALALSMTMGERDGAADR